MVVCEFRSRVGAFFSAINSNNMLKFLQIIQSYENHKFGLAHPENSFFESKKHFFELKKFLLIQQIFL